MKEKKTMWNPFKKSEEKKREEVYKFVLYCSKEFWFICTDHYLTINQKRHKCYKKYIGIGQYIYNKYGQKYLEFFEEKMYERGWINKTIFKDYVED